MAIVSIRKGGPGDMAILKSRLDTRGTNRAVFPIARGLKVAMDIKSYDSLGGSLQKVSGKIYPTPDAKHSFGKGLAIYDTHNSEGGFFAISLKPGRHRHINHLVEFARVARARVKVHTAYAEKAYSGLAGAIQKTKIRYEGFAGSGIEFAPENDPSKIIPIKCRIFELEILPPTKVFISEFALRQPETVIFRKIFEHMCAKQEPIEDLELLHQMEVPHDVDLANQFLRALELLRFVGYLRLKSSVV